MLSGRDWFPVPYGVKRNATVESGSVRSKIAPTVGDAGAVTPHPPSLPLGHLPLKGMAGGCGGGIGLRTVGDAGPYNEERSAFVIVGATCVSPVVHRFYLGSSVMRWWYRVFYPSVTALAVTAPLSRGAKRCGGGIGFADRRGRRFLQGTNAVRL